MSIDAKPLFVAGYVLLGLAANAQAQIVVTPAPDGLYPRAGVERSAPQPVIRGCTQLELSASIDREACGTLTLAEVIRELSEKTDDED